MGEIAVSLDEAVMSDFVECVRLGRLPGAQLSSCIARAFDKALQNPTEVITREDFVEAGRRGGSVASRAKRIAARSNGAKGGRPKGSKNKPKPTAET
jgi:hypothetical protein